MNGVDMAEMLCKISLLKTALLAHKYAICKSRIFHVLSARNT